MSTSFLFGASKVHANGFASNLNPLKPILDDWEKIKLWFEELPKKLTKWAIDGMSEIYELITSLILKTPLWLFENEWFHNTTYKFSLIAVVAVSIITAFEGIKRMLPKWTKKPQETTDLKEIIKRWFLVSCGITAVPWVTYESFKGLNFISEILINMGKDDIKSISLTEAVKPFDVLILLIFNILLILSAIPILWQNGRRFFDILVLTAISPFALSAWVFNSYKSYFNQWWNNLKHLSLVQVYYALYLLILGWFIYGVPTPSSLVGLLTKMLIVIGAFSRMQNPPTIIAHKLDRGGGFDEVLGSGKKTMDNIKRNIEFTKGIILKNPQKIFKSLSKDRMSNAKILDAKEDGK